MSKQLNGRIVELLHELSRDNYQNLEIIAQRLHLSEKTVRNRIEELNHILEPNGAFIERKRGSGVLLRIDNEIDFSSFMNKLEKQENIPDNSNDRTLYILNMLLSSKKYIKKETLAEILYVSEKTITNNLSEIEKLIKPFDLSLIRKPNYGIIIEGFEFQKRMCILNCLLSPCRNLLYQSAKDIQINVLGSLIFQITQKNGMEFHELAFQNLVSYLETSIIRINDDFIIEENILDDQHQNIQNIARQILEVLKSCGFISSYSPAELNYVAIFLIGSGKLMNIDYEALTMNFIIQEYIEKLAVEMIDSIYESTKVDLRKDLGLKLRLIQHLAPLDIRVRYGIAQTNPNLENIRRAYLRSYMMAQQAIHVLEEYYNKPISEAEIGYISLLFELALQKKSSSLKKWRIVLLCSTGSIGSVFLKHRLNDEFHDSIESIEMRSVNNFVTTDFKDFDYVFSTVTITQKIPIPVIMIKDFFDQYELLSLKKQLSKLQQKKLIEAFYREDLFISRLQADSKKDVLKKMSDHMLKKYPTSCNLYQLLIDREEIGSTDYGNHVAMPHPNEITYKESLVSVAILEDPIIWSMQEVQIVIVSCIIDTTSEETQQFYDITASLIFDMKKIQRLIKERKYGTLVDCLM